MKSLFYIFTAVLLLTSASCKKEDDTTKTCDYGYEGTDCTTETRQKFIGTYTVEQTTDLPNTYQIQTVKVADVYAFTIRNITDEGHDIRAEVSKIKGQSNAFDIPVQVVGGHTFSGSGYLNSGVIDMLVSVDGVFRTVRTPE